MTADPSERDPGLGHLREKTDRREEEIAHLGAETISTGASAPCALVERLRSEARVREELISRQLQQLAADEVELEDLRAIRDALTPPDPASRPGVDLAASFLPATGGVSGDFYLVAEGPHEATALVVGDVVGKLWKRLAERRSSARCSPPRRPSRTTRCSCSAGPTPR